jgi:hypothetical protein
MTKKTKGALLILLCLVGVMCHLINFNWNLGIRFRLLLRGYVLVRLEEPTAKTTGMLTNNLTSELIYKDTKYIGYVDRGGFVVLSGAESTDPGSAEMIGTILPLGLELVSVIGFLSLAVLFLSKRKRNGGMKRGRLPR